MLLHSVQARHSKKIPYFQSITTPYIRILH